MLPEAIFFDLDETLSDRTSAMNEFAVRLIERYFGEVEPERLQNMLNHIRIADGDGYRDKEEFYRDIVGRWGWEKAPAFEEYIGYWESEYPQCSMPMEELIPVLDYFQEQGVPLGVMTNGFTSVQNAKIDRLGIRSYFKSIVISEEAGFRKPDERIYQIGLKSLGSEAERTWFVGDHPVNDILAAQKAGMKGIWLERVIPWPVQSEEQPFASIETLYGLIDVHKRFAGSSSSV